MKLHLGCGELYLQGYQNIDFPTTEHTVQTNSVADEHSDILTLRYPASSIDEIRLHHVFEHFTRPVACGLLASWHSWLKPGGLIHIEVPDFKKNAQIMLNPFTSLQKKLAAERHLFGSHEAQWAVHCEGYTASILQKKVKAFGYSTKNIQKIPWLGIHNFALYAVKNIGKISRTEFENITARYLSNYLVDDSDTEKRLLRVWMDIYKNQVDKCWASDG